MNIYANSRFSQLRILWQVEQGKKELKKLLTENPDDITLQNLQGFEKEKYLNENY